MVPFSKRSFRFHDLNILRLALIGVAIVLAALHAHATRFKISPDGVSYLDMGAAFIRGDWALAVNGYWGPMYAWLLGILVGFTHAEGLAQFEIAHFLNFLIYLLDVFLFDRFWCGIVAALPNSPAYSRTRAAVLYIGYVIFMFLFVVILEDVTPDLLLTAVVLAVGQCLWRFATTLRGRWMALAGALFGLGYLVKAIMLPVGLAVFFVAGVVFVIQRQSLKPVLAGLAIQILVSSPLVIVLSHRAGHFSTGDTGRLSYAWLASGPLPDLLVTPGKIISSEPIIYQVETRPHVTYWAWFDPGAASENVRATLNFKQQLHVLFESLKIYRDEMLFANGPLLMAIIVLLSLRTKLIRLLPYAPLFALVFAALGAYAMILVQDRYISPFACVMWGALLGIALAGLGENEIKFSNRLLIVAAVFLTLRTLPTFASYALNIARTPRTTTTVVADASIEHVHVTRALQANGMIPGDKVALIGNPFLHYWAKLGNVSISAYIPPKEFGEFCHSGLGPSEKVIELIRSTGAQWVISSVDGSSCPTNWWRPIPGTSYRFHKI